MFTIQPERLTATQYIDFLKRTDLGSQYPKERFQQRIETLVQSAPISLTARDKAGTLLGVCFGITDFAYWLFLTDLGVDRDYVGQGIGSQLLHTAHEAAGGQRDIILYTCAAQDAVPFYEKQGLMFSQDVMQLNRVDWTEFPVK